MTFNIPTTKTQLYQTLNDIFNFYRVSRPQYEGITLEALKIPRQTYTPLSDSELLAKAELLLKAEQGKIIEEKRAELFAEQTKLSAEITGLSVELGVLEQNINSEYAELKEKLNLEAKKRGISNSSIFISKLAEIESERASKIAQATTEIRVKESVLNEKLQIVNVSLVNLEEDLYPLFSKQIETKVRELKDKEEELIRDVFRYNNGLEEKEQRSENAVKQAQANLELKYAEIKSVDLSHDQLVNMGYYKDAMECVCGFYDTAFSTPAAAYSDMLEESNLAIYLDEYFSQVLYLYKSKITA